MPIPLLPLQGQDIALVRITHQTVTAATGALNDNATIATITGKLDSATVRERITSEEISAITSSRENHVALQSGQEIVLREVLDRRTAALPTTGSVLSKLKMTVESAPYVKIEISRGGNQWTIYGLYSTFEEGPYTAGKCTAEMAFLPIDNGDSVIFGDVVQTRY